MRSVIMLTLLVPVFYSHICPASGIQVGRTRIIYEAGKKEVSLPLTNTDSELPWLIQSWTDIGDEKTRGPFIVTPPLFRENNKICASPGMAPPCQKIKRRCSI